MTADETQEEIAPPGEFDLFEEGEDKGEPETESGEPESEESEEIRDTTSEAAQRSVVESRGEYGGPWADEEEAKIWGPIVYDGDGNPISNEPKEEGE